MSSTAQRIAARYLKVFAQEEQQEQQEPESQGQEQGQGQGQEQESQAPAEGGEGDEPNYGGKGPFSLPPEHIAAMQVPAGGACCAKCKFVDVTNHACLEPNYVTWNGGDPALPDLPLDQICSDWFAEGAPEGAPEEAAEEPISQGYMPGQGQGQGQGQGHGQGQQGQQT